MDISTDTKSTKETQKAYFKDPWFFALLSAFLLLVLLAARLITEPDLGFHLRGGEWMLQNHRFFTNDVYTYTLTYRPYLDIHWLYQILLYSVYSIGSYSGLAVLNIFLLIGVFLLTYRRLRSTAAPLWMCVVLLTVTLIASETRFKVRPENLSWLLMALTLWILELRSSRKRDLLFLLPIIDLFWANIEGLFGLSWALMVIFILSGYFHTRKLDRKLLAYSALSLLVCFLNPNFIQGALYPLTQMGMLGPSSAFHQYIGELSPTWSLATNKDRLFLTEMPLLTYKVFSFFLLFLILATFKRRKVHEVLLALSFFYLSTTAYRNIPLFMLAVAPIAAKCWNELHWKWLLDFQNSFFKNPLLPAAFTLFLLLFGIRVATNAYYISDRRVERFGLGLDPERQPVQATQFLSDHHLDGRILNQDKYGGWLDWKGPQKVFVDGRLEVMDEAFYNDYLSAYQGGLERLAQKYQADIIFFGPSDCDWAIELARSSDWRIVYLDDFMEIYLKKGYAPQVPQIDTDDELKGQGIPRSIADDPASILNAPRPSAFQNWMGGFYGPQTYPNGLYNAANFFIQSKHPALAESALLRAIQETNGKYWEFYLKLSNLYFDARKYDEAKTCLEKVLEADPHNVSARHNLEYLNTHPASI